MRLLLCLLVVGCTSNVVHPYKSSEDFARDDYECRKDASTARDKWEGMDLYWRCLRVKGWKEQ